MDYKDFVLVPQHENYITIANEEGTEELFQIIFSIESEKLNKYYVVFSKVSDIEQSYSEDGDDQVEVGAAELVLDAEGNGELVKIETEEEWLIVEQGLQEFDENFEELMEEHHECHCHCDEHNHEYCDCDCDGECDCDEECDGEEGCHCGCCHHEEE